MYRMSADTMNSTRPQADKVSLPTYLRTDVVADFAFVTSRCKDRDCDREGGGREILSWWRGNVLVVL